MALINTEIMAHPLNWLTVFLMCGFALVLLALLVPDTSTPPAA
jgi:hypothetical protein